MSTITEQPLHKKTCSHSCSTILIDSIVSWETVQRVQVSFDDVDWCVETTQEYEKYMASEKEICPLFSNWLFIALESDKLPLSSQNPSAPLSQEEINQINNENKEIRFLVRIDRIKVRNIGNYNNVFCKFKFADKAPMKVRDFNFLLFA